MKFDEPTEQPTFTDAVKDARDVLDALDDTSMRDMDALFYEHGYWQLFSVLEALLAAVDHDHDGS